MRQTARDAGIEYWEGYIRVLIDDLTDAKAMLDSYRNMPIEVDDEDTGCDNSST